MLIFKCIFIIQIIFLVTDTCSDSISNYTDIVQATSGQILNLDNSGDLSEVS